MFPRSSTKSMEPLSIFSSWLAPASSSANGVQPATAAGGGDGVRPRGCGGWMGGAPRGKPAPKAESDDGDAEARGCERLAGQFLVVGQHVRAAGVVQALLGPARAPVPAVGVAPGDRALVVQ